MRIGLDPRRAGFERLGRMQVVGAEPGTDEAGSLDLRSLLGLLRRQKRIILVTFLVVLGLAGVVILSLRPAYTATALVLVDPSRKDLLDPTAQATAPSSDSARVESEVELVETEATLLSVIETENLVADPEFGPQLSTLDTVLTQLRLRQPELPTGETALRGVVGRLQDAVDAQRRGMTYLIAISAGSADPARSARLANAVAEAYIRTQVESKVAATLALRDIVANRIADAGAAVVAAEEASDSFLSESLADMPTQSGRTDLQQLQRDLEVATAARDRQVTLAETVNRQLDGKDWAALARSLQSEALAELEADRRNLAATLVSAADGSEQAIDLRAQLARLEDQFDAAARDQLSTLEAEVAARESEAAELRNELRSSVLSSDLPAALLTNIYELQQRSEIARSQYQALLSRLKDLETQAYLQVADSRIAAAAVAPETPSFPDTRMLLSAAGLLALAFGVGLAFLHENFIGGFTSEDQLQSLLRTPVIGIPKQRGLRRTADGSEALTYADSVVEQPLSRFSESIRRVAIKVDQAIGRLPDHASRGGAVVMVTSAEAGEGKTTVSLSLARTYALAGRSTLLIDCDLRKPSVHALLGLEPSTGLLEYLTRSDGSVPLSSIVTRDRDTEVQVAVGSRPSDRATNTLITGAAFSRLLEAARKSFDVVILDTPPVDTVVDGLYLAGFADVIVFVVRWASTSQQDARSAVAALDDSKRPDVEVLAVLNQQDGDKSSYRARASGYYTDS